MKKDYDEMTYAERLEKRDVSRKRECTGSVLMWCDDCGIRLKFNIDGCPCCGSQNIQTLDLPQ